VKTYSKAFHWRLFSISTLAFFLAACGAEDGLVDDGKNDPPSIPQDYLPEIARPSFPKVNFGVLTSFRYNVNWETDGRSPDQAAFARRVPSAARSLHGRRVSVEGYMIPVILLDNDSKTTEFLLLPDTKVCCEGNTPRQNGWILVRTSPIGVKPQIDKLLRVTGEFMVQERWNPADGFFKGLYHMTCETLAPVAL
jgi:hypothetical protein